MSYVQNQPRRAYDHFYALKEARDDLLGYALFDRLELPEGVRDGLVEHTWRRREFENYFCTREVLLRWTEAACDEHLGPLFVEGWRQAMEESITDIDSAMATLGRGSPWSEDSKVSSDFLEPLFEAFFTRVGLPNLMKKSDYHKLARHMQRDDIDSEVSAVLDQIQETVSRARSQSLPT